MVGTGRADGVVRKVGRKVAVSGDSFESLHDSSRCSCKGKKRREGDLHTETERHFWQLSFFKQLSSRIGEHEHLG